VLGSGVAELGAGLGAVLPGVPAEVLPARGGGWTVRRVAIAVGVGRGAAEAVAATGRGPAADAVAVAGRSVSR
jgi:hypothetical protein